MKRPFLVAVGLMIGLFFAVIAVTGISLLVTQSYLSKPYTVTVTILNLLLAYAGFQLAGDALQTKRTIP